MKLVVLFSEPITLSLPPAEVVTLQVAGSPASCESYLTTADGLYFTCADLTPDAKVAVSLGTGVQSTMSGVAIDAASWTVDVGVLPPGSCRLYSTPI